MYRGMLGTYMYGILQWSPGPIQGVGCFLLCNLLLLLECVGLVLHCESLWWSTPGWCTGLCYEVVICLRFVCANPFHLHSTITVHYLLHCVWSLLVITRVVSGTFGPACLLDDAFMVKLFGATLKKAVKK
jgi:hypothetical protein